MKKLLTMTVVLALALTLLTACGKKAELLQYGSTEGLPKVTMTITGFGDIEMVLYPEEAPKTVENFLTLAKDGYYDGVQFHRVMEQFMIQGGDPTATGAGGQSTWGTNFEDEFSDNLYCFRGALCMANAGPNTNGSQFFIVQAETADSDFQASIDYHKQSGYGRTEYSKEVQDKYAEVGGTPHLDGMHTVFGHVTEGMDVVDTIAAVPVDDAAKPLEAVKIEKIVVEE